MDRADIEAELQRVGAMFVEPRLMRKVIQTDRRMIGIGLQVPHTHCYGIKRDSLLLIIDPGEIEIDPESLSEEVVLLTRLPPSRAFRKRPELMRNRLRRYLYHARAHLELEGLVRTGQLTPVGIRERIEHVGRSEFEEVRAILRHDEMLLPPYDDQQQYIEFVALYLELKHFAPDLLTSTFPSLESLEHVDDVIALDFDPAALYEVTFGEEINISPSVPPSASTSEFPEPMRGSTSTEPSTESHLRPPNKWQVRRMIRAADSAKSKSNDVRSALLYTHARLGSDDPQIDTQIDADLADLVDRMQTALFTDDDPDTESFSIQWKSLCRSLVDEAVQHRGRRYPIEARLLFDLQRAATAHEHPRSALDVAGWIASLGKKPMLRPLPATREVRIARCFHDALRKVPHTRIAAPDRKLLDQMLVQAGQTADRNVRLALRPTILAALDSVGLCASTTVEQIARHKLVEELLDEIVERGFTSFSRLRDALSRNQLKLRDLSNRRRLLEGDELLRLDRLLAQTLNGVYRPGEIYLRGLQRITALPFGTRFGRFLFLFLILPFGGSYLLLEGLNYIVVNPLYRMLGFRRIVLLNPTSFLVTALLTFSLVHLVWFRRVAKKLLVWIGWLLLALFIHLPRWILHRRIVSRLFSIHYVRAGLRRIVLPSVLAAIAYQIMHHLRWSWTGMLSVVVFGLTALIMGPRIGGLLEELLFDWIAPQWRIFSHQVVPGLMRLIADVFRRLMDRIEREIYRVDELLYFRTGQGRILMTIKAVVGLAWGVIAYLIRMYITLFVEPELNPLKHFPVATVAHKLTLPILLPVPPLAISYFKPFFPPVITFLLGTFVSVTVFIMPSVFGFLAWELKENRKLYRATRAKLLEPVPLGSHGETVPELLLPGLHSGTLPKLYERLRRNAQQEDELARIRQIRGTYTDEKAKGYRARFNEEIKRLETDVQRFVEREILALLEQSKGWSYGCISVESISCGSNRIRIRLSCTELDPDPCEISLEEQEGFILASVSEKGFVPKLSQAEKQAKVLFENALVGLYCLAGVDIVNEQIVQAIGTDSAYDIVGKHLVVWPEQDYRTEILYKIRSAFRRSNIPPKLRGQPLANKPPYLTRKQIFLNRDSVTWQKWEQAWQEEPDSPALNLLQNLPILPIDS